MANPYYDSSGYPSQGSLGRSDSMRAEFDAIEVGFDKLPDPLTADEFVCVNAGGTAMETKSVADMKTLLAYTKSDIGLGNVQNLDQRNADNITSGTVADARIASTIARDTEVTAAVGVVNSSLTDHINAVSAHAKSAVGLGNVPNTDCTNASNISSGTLAAARVDSAIARLSSPALVDVPTAPTAAPGTNTTQIANTAFVTAAVAAIDFAKGCFHLQDRKSQGATGGNSTSTTTHTRTLNTEVASATITGASLGSNQVTLPAGTYKVSAWATAYGNIGNMKLRLYNTTAAAYILEGASFAGATSGGATMAWTVPMHGIFTLASQGVLELRHYCQNAVTDGLGKAVSQGTEVYADLYFEEV
jgi:hypothetical protein